MTTIMIFVLSMVLIALNITAAFVLADAMDEIHARRSGWIKRAAFLIVILLFETAAGSWMPEHLGLEIAFMDGEMGGIHRSRAFLFNLGVMLCFEALGYGLALIKDVWNKIRKKENHPGWQLLMYIAVIALCATVGLWLTESESNAPNGPTLWPDSVTFAIMVVTGIITATVIGWILSIAGKSSPEAAQGKEK